MSNDWISDKKWSDRFVPQIKTIIAGCLIHTAPLHEDINHNTDLVVLKTEDNIRFACRVRRPRYMRCKHEFTIRYRRLSGVPTEWNKIIQGWGDYIFYGIAEDENNLGAWGIGKLECLRKHIEQYRDEYSEDPGTTMKTPDGTLFKVFQWRTIDTGFIVKAYNIETEAEDILRKARNENQKIETILPKKVAQPQFVQKKLF